MPQFDSGCGNEAKSKMARSWHINYVIQHLTYDVCKTLVVVVIRVSDSCKGMPAGTDGKSYPFLSLFVEYVLNGFITKNTHFRNMMVTVCEGEVAHVNKLLRVSSILVACRGRFRSPLSNTVLIDNVRHRIEMGPGFDLLEQPIARTFGRAYLPMPQQGVVLCNQPIPDTILDEVLGGREHVLRGQIRCKEIEIVSALSC